MLPLLLTLCAAATFIAVACIIAGARYDRARDKAWAEFKPRPLRVFREVGEPPHGEGGTR